MRLHRLPTSQRDWVGLLVIFGIIELCRAAYLRLRSKATQSWKPITATITQSQVGERTYNGRSGEVTEYRPDIIYVYTVAGTDHAGTQVYPGGDPWVRSQSLAAEVVNRYSPGARVLAHYNPAKPDKAVLTRETQNAAYGETFLGVVSLILAMILSKMTF